MTGAEDFVEKEVIQELWSGYGKIKRLKMIGGSWESIIIKLISAPKRNQHPRGWNSEIGHQRKLKSYEVERIWYEKYSARSPVRIPKFLGATESENETLLLLEDLDAAGYPLRKNGLNETELKACIAWLAKFHARFLGQQTEGLWPKGSYWHLETRPQELEALEDRDLKAAAPLIDQKLDSAQYQTLIHGDAKLANFCFAPDGKVAALDFQYVGGGCGMKDLAYFVGSCLTEEECERLEEAILETYFEVLQAALKKPNARLEEEWRALYPFAWADFHRFLKGWSPGHWKINSYSERLCSQVIKKLNNES